MAKYPGSERERRIRAEDLQEVVTAIFRSCGMPPDPAALLAHTLVLADLRGVHSHGVLRVPDYVAKLTKEGVDPAGVPRVVQDSGAAIVIDGGNSMGQIGGTFAMEKAIERARDINVAVAAVRGSNHCGAMDYYAMMALPHDMIGIAMTNALPTMAPWGSTEKILGINPIAVAIPAGHEDPIVLDIAFAATAHGKIRVYHQKGLPIPEGWAFDRDGNPTTDTAKALEGLLAPIGGYKGTGLALITGILSTLLSGAAFGTELGNMVDGPKPGADGHLFMAIRVGAFEKIERFKARVDDIVRQIKTGRPAPGVTQIYPPGGLEAEFERRYRAEGIPLNDATLNDILTIARARGIQATPIETLLQNPVAI